MSLFGAARLTPSLGSGPPSRAFYDAARHSAGESGGAAAFGGEAAEDEGVATVFDYGLGFGVAVGAGDLRYRESTSRCRCSGVA